MENLINDFLNKTRETHDFLMKKNRKELAIEVLKTGSILATTLLKMNDINKEFVCACGKEMKTETERLFLQKIGSCPSCDHVYGEYIGELLYEDNSANRT